MVPRDQWRPRDSPEGRAGRRGQVTRESGSKRLPAFRLAGALRGEGGERPGARRGAGGGGGGT